LSLASRVASNPRFVLQADWSEAVTVAEHMALEFFAGAGAPTASRTAGAH
jgi:hypothetical protein